MTDVTPEAPEPAVEPVVAEAVPQAPPEPVAAEPAAETDADAAQAKALADLRHWGADVPAAEAAAIQAEHEEALARWGARDVLAGSGVSLGEQPHDSANCDRGGQPHLGPCVEPEPVTAPPEPAPEGEAVLAAHPEWAYLFALPPLPVRPATDAEAAVYERRKTDPEWAAIYAPVLPPVSPEPAAEERTPVGSGAPVIGGAAS